MKTLEKAVTHTTGGMSWDVIITLRTLYNLKLKLLILKFSTANNIFSEEITW